MIAVLLSTYNGGLYLSEQLDSIINQTCQDYVIYIRDDGSTDNTIDIIKSYCQKYPQKVVCVDDPQKHRGANYSFLWLLGTIKSDYYMFCDQDDIWLPNKIEISYLTIKKVEDESGNIPILVHTDMKVVDENLNIISESLYKEMKIKPQIVDNSFNFMGVCSCGPGCSMIFNNYAKDVSLQHENLNDVPMHDWWVAINTVKNGIIRFIAEPTMLYRQHHSNTVGASNVNSAFMLGKVAHIKRTMSPYKNEMKWLKNVGYGGKWKYLLYKFLYNIIRMI